MKTKTFILASVALSTLGVGSAMSGPCTTEIDGLTKTLNCSAAVSESGDTVETKRAAIRFSAIRGDAQRSSPGLASTPA